MVSVGGAEAQLSVKTLKGLGSVAVSVGSSSCLPVGLNEYTTKTEVELRLRQVGIRVEDSSRAALNVLALCYQVKDPRVDIVAYSVRAYVKQFTLWGKPSEFVDVITWQSLEVIGAGSNEGLEKYIRDKIQDRVSEFLNAYLAANQ